MNSPLFFIAGLLITYIAGLWQSPFSNWPYGPIISHLHTDGPFGSNTKDIMRFQAPFHNDLVWSLCWLFAMCYANLENEFMTQTSWTPELWKFRLGDDGLATLSVCLSIGLNHLSLQHLLHTHSFQTLIFEIHNINRWEIEWYLLKMFIHLYFCHSCTFRML